MAATATQRLEPTDLFGHLRPEALAAPESGIVEVVNYGRGREGLIPLWVGEGDFPTPAFICDAATRSLAAGETFYGHQRGHPELREAIARYMKRVYGRRGDDDPARYFVTIGGMHAVQMAIRLIAGSGDDVIVPTPVWPNFAAALTIAGARCVELPMRFSAARGRAAWTLDIDDLAAAIGPRTRAICINSPANPSGWIAAPQDHRRILELARRHGLWIVADEIYGRLTVDGERAPSLRDVTEDGDRVMFVQTFSKNWAMSGWRLGWLEAPPELGQTIENLIQYSTSGVPVFAQRAAIAALEHGEDFVAALRARIRRNLDVLRDGLGASDRLRFALPSGGFYLFLGIDTDLDTRSLAMRIIDEAGVGLAPGTAFGRGGEGFLRLCFARNPDDIVEATRRLVAWLAH